jgi:hypothetical protein
MIHCHAGLHGPWVQLGLLAVRWVRLGGLHRHEALEVRWEFLGVVHRYVRWGCGRSLMFGGVSTVRFRKPHHRGRQIHLYILPRVAHSLRILHEDESVQNIRDCELLDYAQTLEMPLCRQRVRGAETLLEKTSCGLLAQLVELWVGSG